MTPSNEIVIDTAPRFQPEPVPASVRGYVKHVRCEGARFHVLYWDSNGCHCTDPKCIINHRPRAA
jgi:hypothetical protein